MSAAKRVAATPSPVNPSAYADPPRCAVPQKQQNRVQVSITPPHECPMRTPASCGNVSSRCRTSSSYVASRCSVSGLDRLP